jgi:aryl-alcohol dehydrogenase-like predicted oxidoreductase
MKTDYIDFYQCHIGDLKDPTVFLEAFDRLVERGKVRAYGVSTNSLEVAQAFNRDGKCAAVQLNYSLVNPGAGRDLLPWCAANDVGTLIRGPIAQGVLAGKFTPESRFDDAVRVGWNEGPAREQFLQRLAYVEQIRFLDRPGRSLVQAALQWVLADPAVTCAIPGAKSVDQVRSNAAAADEDLTPEELDRLRRVTPGFAA